MNDIEELVLLYLKYRPGETAEDVLSALSADSLGHRLALANALEYLVCNGRIKKDLTTGALELRESVK